MSDVDDIDFMKGRCNSSTFLYPMESLGPPPSPIQSPTLRSTKHSVKRKHRRSVSEQIFTKAGLHGNGPKSYFRERCRRRNKSEEMRMSNIGSWKESYGGGGGSLCSFETGRNYDVPIQHSAYCSNFPTFHDPQDATMKLSISERSHGGTHFKQTLRRTENKAFSSSRAVNEGITECALNDNSMGTFNLRNRYKRMSNERKRHQRRGSSCSDFMDNASALGICRLTIRNAKLKGKYNCCVRVQYMDKLIAKSEFSGETRNPVWNKKIRFPISSTNEPLELQIIESHKVRSDKLIGRAYIYLHRDEAVCSHEAPIKYFNLKKGGSQELGTICVETFVEPDFYVCNDDCTTLEPPGYSEKPDEVASEITTTSYVKRIHLYKRLSSMLTSSVHLPSFNRPAPSLKEPSSEPSVRSDDEFYFSPCDVTRRYLEIDGAVPSTTVPWRPFFDWPGHRCLDPPMMAFKRRYPVHFWELRIPKISWPIEFLVPMARLEFPAANMVDTLDVGDTVKFTKIVESGFVNIYLVGVRGLKSIPQVEMVARSGLDDWSGGIGSNVGGLVPGSMLGTNTGGSTVVASEARSSITSLGGGSFVNIASPETRAATLVALHWAAKSLTLQPSPQVEFTYGCEKKSSSIVKNNSNPDFLEEFDFRVKNGSPRFIRITVHDRETRAGTGGIPRSSILGESVIDLNDMPLEMTQKMELQLLKNSDDARILMFVTITGLTIAARSPVQKYTEMNQQCPTISTASGVPLSHSIIIDDGSKICFGETCPEMDDKSDLPNLPSTLLEHLSAHYSFGKSFTNYQDIGWMRVKICSAMGLGGKTANGRIEIFCAVDMFNIHLRTQSIIKHKNPTWNRCFVIPLSDIHGIMKITVVEVDRNKAEIIGGLAIHPLRIDNGENKWYALKTPDLRSPTKGSILLEFNVVYNKFKSALKSFSPMEPRYRSIAMKQKSTLSTIQELLQRLENLKPLLESMRRINQTLDDWWLWKNPIHSILGLIGYQLLVFYFQPYFIPLFMILMLLKNRICKRRKVDAIINYLMHSKTPVQLASSFEHEIYKDQYELLERLTSNRSLLSEQSLRNEEEDVVSYGYRDSILETAKQLYAGPQGDLPVEEEAEERYLAPAKLEGKKTVKTVRSAFKEKKTLLFEILENIASTYERVEGLFNWRIPWLSILFVMVLLLLTVTLFFVPVKFLLMLYGFSKFTKAVLRPNALINNELMDILSRVPDLIEAVELTEYRPDAFTIPAKGKLSRT